MLKTTLSAPWDSYYKEVNAMFENDPDVKVVFDNENYKIKVYVERQAKAEVLSLMLKPSQVFGNITLEVEVITPNKRLTMAEGVYEEAFRDNPAVSYVKVYSGVFHATYIVFTKEVVQYFNDDLSSIGRVHSTLYETIAKNIFEEIPGVYFCTDTEENSIITYSGGRINYSGGRTNTTVRCPDGIYTYDESRI